MKDYKISEKSIIKYPNSDIYEDNFENDKQDDIGKKIYTDDRIKNGYFENEGNIKDSREDFPFKLTY